MSKRHRPMIAVTVGDPGGIGPEIVGRLFDGFQPRRSTAVIVGALKSIEPFIERSIDLIDSVDAASAGSAAGVCFVDTGCGSRYSVGRDSVGGGRHAARALELACRLAKAGVVQGIVTAPVSKRALNRAGYRFTGHTEYLARYFGAPDCQMMMVYRKLRVVPITRHIPIRKVSRALTSERIVTGLAVVDEALRTQFGIRAPRLAVAGLNPHAGEGGVLGDEDDDVIVPAIRRARRWGVDATGPIPADAMFQTAQDGTFDAFVSMYHDQGLIPFKMIARRRGVNVTVGLPIVRTSVDHGVAYDLAGSRSASFSSLKAAYQLAERLVVRGRMGTA